MPMPEKKLEHTQVKNKLQDIRFHQKHNWV